MTVPPSNQLLNEQNRPLTVGDWIITFTLLSIPFVGLIFLVYWALSSTSNVNRKNFCIAYIIIMVLLVALVVVLMIFGVLAGFMGDFMPKIHGTMVLLHDFYGQAGIFANL